MMPEDIRQKLLTKPFVPFRMLITDGTSYEIRHPDCVYVTRTHIVIAPELSGDLPKGLVICDPLYVTQMIPLSDGGNKNRNGKRK